MTLTEIAKRINAHLKRFEADPVINKPEKTRLYQSTIRPFFYAWARRSGRWVYVQYISYQGQSALTRIEAEKYLSWLDSGNVGKHWEVKP